MIRPVVGTIGTRVALALLNLAMVVVASQRLGAEGVGVISLIILGITFILLMNNIVGGGGLVYLTPRHGLDALRWPSYAWALVTALAASLMVSVVPLVPSEYALHLVALAFLQSLCTIHLGLMLGRQRIAAHNAVLIVQAGTLLLAFLWFLDHGNADVMDHVHAGYLAHGLTALVSGILSRAPGSSRSRPNSSDAIRDLFRQGGLAQAANGLQLLNYRFTYLLIQKWLGASSLGLFAITTQLSESAWLVPKSLGQVLYARVSNSHEADEQRAQTLAALKASMAFTLVVVGALLILPDVFYRAVFGPEITGLAPLVLVLAPGLLAMAASQAISHFLSGTGRVRHNTIGSGLGTVLTLVLGLYLVPRYGLMGAAATASSAYCCATFYQWLVFSRLAMVRLHHLLPDARDAQRLRTLWRRALGR